MRSFSERIVGVAKLEVEAFEEVEEDETATGQAMGVVVLSSLAAGLGAMGVGIGGMVVQVFEALLRWVLWAGLTYFIGTRLLPEPQTQADVGQLMRTLGFAQAPGILRVVGGLPVIGGLTNLIVSIWMLVTMVIAVRQALDYSNTMRAVAVILSGFLIQLVVLAVLFAGLGS